MSDADFDLLESSCLFINWMIFYGIKMSFLAPCRFKCEKKMDFYETCNHLKNFYWFLQNFMTDFTLCTSIWRIKVIKARFGRNRIGLLIDKILIPTSIYETKPCTCRWNFLSFQDMNDQMIFDLVSALTCLQSLILTSSLVSFL